MLVVGALLNSHVHASSRVLIGVGRRRREGGEVEVALKRKLTMLLLGLHYHIYC